MRIIHALNEYFFDVEDEGEAYTDVVSASIFYGVCLIGIIVTACVALVWAI